MDLYYVTPLGSVLRVPSFDREGSLHWQWLNHMIDEHPNFIFFLTVSTTDLDMDLGL